MKTPDDKSIEQLLRGNIREPSTRFESALRGIPDRREVRKGRQWLPVLRPLAIAAALIIGLLLFMEQENAIAPSRQPEDAQVTALDAEWIGLLSLANSLKSAGSLANAEARLVLDYYAFNQ